MGVLSFFLFPRVKMLQWFLPACAGAFTLMLSLHHHNEMNGQFLRTNAAPSMAMVWYGEGLFSPSTGTWSRSTAPGSTRDLNLEWNLFSKATFEWTNQHQITSSMGSLSGSRTNF
jgi:hypothetical protein